MYTFVQDTAAGDTKGEAVNNVWFLFAQPFYTVGLGTDATLGNYLVDSEGQTLYYFDKDPQGESVCSGNCLANWPVFHVDGVVAPAGVNAADFGELIRADGVKQTTFKDYPLYYFAADQARGDLKGQAVNDVWFVVDPVKFTGTTAGQAGSGSAPVPSTDKVTIEMKEYSFTPTQLVVKAGTTIEFVNRDEMEHNAVAVDGSFRTELLAQGESATIKLDKPGVYEYYCEPHKSFMKGTITVE